MNKGLFILIMFGMLLLAFLYMSPVTPAADDSTQDTPVSNVESNKTEVDVDAMVDEALRELQSGTVPPMQGILEIRDIADKYPTNVKANFTLGILSMETSQYAKAIERFEAVLAQDPEYGQAWQMLAEAQMNIGDTISAKQSLEKAQSLVNEKTQTQSDKIQETE